MRREEIKVTTPEHSIIYAVGTSPFSNEKIWSDPSEVYWSGGVIYRPAYVLNLNKAGALVLQADSHPDSTYAKKNRQASLLDATDYTFEDFERRRGVLEKFSHWAEDGVEGARKAALEELKAVPQGWRVDRVKTTYVRMLWAEYQAGLTQRAEFRAFRKAQEETAQKESKERFLSVVDLIKSRVELSTSEAERLRRLAGWSQTERMELNVTTLEALLSQLRPIRKPKGTVA